MRAGVAQTGKKKTCSLRNLILRSVQMASVCLAQMSIQSEPSFFKPRLKYEDTCAGSEVRRQLSPSDDLRYLGVMLVLGIAESALTGDRNHSAPPASSPFPPPPPVALSPHLGTSTSRHSLLEAEGGRARVFQTMDGQSRKLQQSVHFIIAFSLAPPAFLNACTCWLVVVADSAQRQAV